MGRETPGRRGRAIVSGRLPPLGRAAFLAEEETYGALQRRHLAAGHLAQQAEASTISSRPSSGRRRNVAKIEYWGLRNLTYRIKKNRKGHYSLLAIDAPAGVVKEMERQLSINEDVLRYMTVRVEELDLELSPILARRDRERERRDDAPQF